MCVHTIKATIYISNYKYHAFITWPARTKAFAFLIFLGLASTAALPSSRGKITPMYLSLDMITAFSRR